MGWWLLNPRKNIYNNKSAITQQKGYAHRMKEGRVIPAGRSLNEVANGYLREEGVPQLAAEGGTVCSVEG